MEATANRRMFLARAALAPAALAWAARAGTPASGVKFGLLADVHQDVMPDAPARVDAFVDAMTKAGADFIVELGDFCQPTEKNRAFLATWDRFKGPRYHVLGNHDMDGGAARDASAAWRGMPAAHYAFDAGPVRGIVLDGNEPGGKAKGYARFVGDAQLAWLETTLAADARPAVLFIHQPPDHESGLENGAAVRAALAKIDAAHPGRVLAVFSGHLHQDYLYTLDGIHHVQVNSASYLWLSDEAAARETWPPDVHRAHPHLRRVAGYREPLWMLATIDLAKGELIIEGRRTEWVGPDPWSRGASETGYPRDSVRPSVSDRRCAVRPPNPAA